MVRIQYTVKERRILLEVKRIRLGNLLLPSNVFMAPLAGYTCYPFRMLCQELGAGLCFTEMVSANGLKYKDKATQRLIFTTPSEKIKAVQLLGSDPCIMEYAACGEKLQFFDVIDINMGCPVPNVFKSGAGSALLGNWKLASDIIRACKRSGKPVTVKCRVGITDKDLIAAEFSKLCEDSGADLITIHGRSRNMMYDGVPFYEQIAQAKSAVSIPVIANGGIFSKEGAERTMNLTGADGVMIARYALENPFVFSELTGRKQTKNKYRIISDQLDLVAGYYDETFSLSYIKKLAAYGMKRRRGTKQYKASLFQCGNLDELRQIVQFIFDPEEKAE